MNGVQTDIDTYVILVMQGKGYVSGVNWLDGGLVVVVDGVLRPCARGEMGCFKDTNRCAVSP